MGNDDIQDGLEFQNMMQGDSRLKNLGGLFFMAKHDDIHGC